MKRTASVVSLAAVLAYFIAVAERSSLGVAAVEASSRFHTNAAQLSALTVLQLAVYAGMQIPVGVLLDRYGSKRLLLVGGLLMTVGQSLVAVSHYLAPAVLGRGILGMGDAFTFISMIRLINHWYSGAAATRRTQLYANFGQLGQVFSAIPFAFALKQLGWSNAYLMLAAFAMFGVCITFALVQDAPGELHDSPIRTPWSAVFSQLRGNLRNPGVRQAFWTHFMTQSSGSIFVLLWGYGFLVQGEGLTPAFASALLGSFVAIGFVVGPLMSQVCAVRPDLRAPLALGVAGSILAVWAAVLLWPGQAPLWLLIVLVLVIGSGGPASMIAFDFTRTYVDKQQLGTANGFVNVGGFVAAFSMMFAVGAVLDLALRWGISRTLFDLAGYKLGMLVQFVVIGGGMLMFSLETRRVAAKSR
ncbi:MAG: hypothetical protein RL672_1397 [Actinomycetota bacterium]